MKIVKSVSNSSLAYFGKIFSRYWYFLLNRYPYGIRKVVRIIFMYLLEYEGRDEGRGWSYDMKIGM